MNKMQEEFEKWRTTEYGKSIGGTMYPYASMKKAYIAGKAADLLPTEGVCPECDGTGMLKIGDNEEPDIITCPGCGGGSIQIYYTPEQYKEITGNDFPDDGAVWVQIRNVRISDDCVEDMWIICTYIDYMDKYCSVTKQIFIVQTAQKCPEIDYRPEV